MPPHDAPTNADSEHKIFINWDTASMWHPIILEGQETSSLDAETIRRRLETIVDRHAAVGVDALIHCVFAGYTTLVPDCRTADTKWSRPFEPLRILDEAGLDLIKIVRDRCRDLGVQFLAGIRTNDRHMGSGQSHNFYPRVEALRQEHPEWLLEEFPGGLDFKYEGVRTSLLAFLEEFLDRYDVDGIEFDWMRWAHVFKPSEAVAHASHLTDFTRSARRQLDDAAARRGQEPLLLGARVPQTMDECIHLGYDVAAWAQDGLVDYLCPSDFFYTDLNTRVEDFVSLAEGTSCAIYPSIHPGLGWDNHAELAGPDDYRAAARNFYSRGAAGVSPYNYQYHWAAMMAPEYPGPAEMWPAALDFLAALKRAGDLDADDRRYLYHPLWSGTTEGHSPTWGYKNDRIVLDCAAETPSGTFLFRMAEDLAEPGLSAELAFKVTYMVAGDTLEVSLNEAIIPPETITTAWRVGQGGDEGRSLGPFFLFRVPLTSPPARSGDNLLQLRLTHRAGMARRMLNAQEFEVRVRGAVGKG